MLTPHNFPQFVANKRHKANKIRPPRFHTDRITITKKASVNTDKNHTNEYQIRKDQFKNIRKLTLWSHCDEAGWNLKQKKSKSGNRI